MAKYLLSVRAAYKAAQQMADETQHSWYVVQYGWADTAVYHIIPYAPPRQRHYVIPT